MSEAAKAAVVALVRQLVDTEFAGNVKAAAAKLDISYSQFHGIYNNKTGGGGKTHERLAAYTRKTVDEVLGRTVVHDDSPEAGNAVGWPEAERAYRKARPDIPEWVYPKARRARNAVLAVPVSLDDVEALVQMAWRNTPPAELVELERQRIEKSNETLRKRHATVAGKKALAAGADNDAPFLTSPTPRGKKGTKKPSGK